MLEKSYQLHSSSSLSAESWRKVINFIIPQVRRRKVVGERYFFYSPEIRHRKVSAGLLASLPTLPQVGRRRKFIIVGGKVVK